MSNFELYRLVNRLEQRVSNLVRVGRISEVMHEPPRVKVEYDKDEVGNAVTTAWLCYFEQRQGNVQTWNPPKIGEQCMIISPAGDLRLGKVLLGLNTAENNPISADSNIHKIKFKDGSIFEFNRSNSLWNISLGNGAAAFVGKTFTFNSNVIINGDIKHKGNTDQIGNVMLKGTLTAKMIIDKTGSMAAMRTIYNGHKHESNEPTPDKQM